jgi:multisubunit Na+/H+ antiporter MnhB subunit
MVKAGVFLLGRMHPVFGTAPLWAPVLVTVGTISMLLGAYQALRETDLKAILARTTASTLGGMTLLYGLGATGADSLAMLNHALYKGALFLVAGIVDHQAHTRSIDELGGLRRALPLACVASVLASLSMAGVPPLLGFVAKDEVYAALFHNAWLAERPLAMALVVAATLAAGTLLVAVAARLTLGVFFGPERPHRREGHGHGSAALPLWPAPLLLAVLTLVLGAASAGPFTRALVVATASDYTGDAHVTLTPPLGPALLGSLAALLLGAGLYMARDRAAALQRRVAFLPAAPAVWDRGMAAFVRIGAGFSRRWQTGSLRRYLAATVLTVPALCLPALVAGGLSWRNVTVSFADLPWYGVLFCAGLALTTVAAVTARTRLAAAIAMTATGFFVSMLFVVYRSPDILLTQLLIETASTIFILLVLAFLPPFRPRDLLPASRLAHAAIAGAFGLTVTLLLLLATSPGLRETDNVSTRPGGLLARALADGGGANAVNVIIVDLRAIDTTGEVTVLVAVGLAVYGLLRLRRGPREEEAA